VKNIFYFIAGLLSVILAATHTWYGLDTALPILHHSPIESSLRTVFTFQLHMIGAQDFIYGIAAICMAFRKDMTKVKFTAWVLIAILLARWVIMTLVTVMYGNVADLLTSSIAFFVLIVLLSLGIRAKDKSLTMSRT